MKLITFLLFLLPSFLLASGDGQAAYLLGKVTNFHRAHPKMMGDFSLAVDGKVQTGVFYYYTSANAQSVKLFFGPTDADIPTQEKYSYWVVNQNKLWVYLSESKVLVEQEIPEYFRTIGILGSGLSHYFAEYKNFSVKEIPAKSQDIQGKGDMDDVSSRELIFTDPIKEKTAFSMVSLEITNDGFQRTTRAISKPAKKGGTTTSFVLQLSNVDFDPDFDETGIFRVIPGGNTQILRNVLMSK